MSFREAMRRVITGDTPEGKSVVVIDGGPSSEIGDILFEIWEDAASGPIDPGAHADLIVVDGDPHRDVGMLQHDGAHMAAIMKGGAFAKCSLA